MRQQDELSATSYVYALNYVCACAFVSHRRNASVRVRTCELIFNGPRITLSVSAFRCCGHVSGSCVRSIAITQTCANIIFVGQASSTVKCLCKVRKSSYYVPNRTRQEQQHMSVNCQWRPRCYPGAHRGGELHFWTLVVHISPWEVPRLSRVATFHCAVLLISRRFWFHDCSLILSYSSPEIIARQPAG